MTNPEASPDGTGTQTDEVRSALATITALIERPYINKADIPPRYIVARSVLSAEIERLTRRVVLLETHLRAISRASQSFRETMGPAWSGDPLNDAIITAEAGLNLTERRMRRVVRDADGRIAGFEDIPPAALASVAAPDERVLAEREACAKIADEFARPIIPSIPAGVITQMTGAAIAAEIRGRTPDQDTAP